MEEQRFTQCWLFLMLGALFIGILYTFLIQDPSREALLPMAIGLLIIGLVFILIISLRLKTRIDNTGIIAYFSPFGFSRKRFSWNDVEECYIRKYSAIREFGGRGFRVKRKKKAYTVAGNRGIQIRTKSKKAFLIGTQRPIDVKTVINYYINRKKEK